MRTPHSARHIAEQVRSGRISAVEALEPFLTEASASRDSINALVATRDGEARADARRVDLQVSSGADPGPLAGVPFTVKDTLSTADLPTTCGSRALAQKTTGFDATAVARLRKAGAILVGKTNTPEFAFGIHTENDLHGRTHNPLGPFTVGGSSGGEAAAVAVGASAFGIGTDFGGSLRWPAQCTALVGLRPSIGLIPQWGQIPRFGDSFTDRASLQALVQVIGPLTHDIADAALVLSVLAGKAVPYDVPEAVEEDVLEHVEVSWGTDVGTSTAEHAVAQAVASAARALGAFGAVLHDSLPRALHDATSIYDRLRASDSHDAIRRAVTGRETLLEPRTQSLLAHQALATDEAAWQSRRQLLTILESFMGNTGVLLLPVSTCPPFLAHEREVDDFTPLVPSRAVSLFGLPAVSVPWTTTAEGAPVSVQLVAPRNREDLALRCARVLEVARAPVIAGGW